MMVGRGNVWYMVLLKEAESEKDLVADDGLDSIKAACAQLTVHYFAWKE